MGNWDYEDVQEKLSHPPKGSEKIETEDTEDVDLSKVEDETEEEEEELEEEEEEEEAEEEEKEKIPEKKESALPGMKDEDKQAIYDQVITRVGKDTILKIRGKEQRVGDLSPEELVVALQKSIDTDRRYQELATQRKQLEMDRALVEKGATAVQQFLEQQGRPGAREGAPALPDYLRPSSDDPEDVKAFKAHVVNQAQELAAMKQYISSSESTGQQQRVVNDILQLRETYPMASVDEVIAVKDVRPDINSEDLMRASHEYYTSAKFIDNAIKASPTFKREYEQKIIRNYIGSQKKSKTLPGRRQGSARVDKVMSSEKPTGLFDFDKARDLSDKYLKEVSRMEKEG